MSYRIRWLNISVALMLALLLTACSQQASPEQLAREHLQTAYPALQCEAVSTPGDDGSGSQVRMRAEVVGSPLQFDVTVQGKSVIDDLPERLWRSVELAVTEHLRQAYDILPYRTGLQLQADGGVTFAMTTAAAGSGGLEYQLTVSADGQITDNLLEQARLPADRQFAQVPLLAKAPAEDWFNSQNLIAKGELVRIEGVTFDQSENPEIPLVKVRGTHGQGYIPLTLLGETQPPPAVAPSKVVLIEQSDLYSWPMPWYKAADRPIGTVARVLDYFGEWLYVQVHPWMADDPSCGWVRLDCLVAYQPELSSEGVLDAGAFIYFGDHPNCLGRNANFDGSLNTPQYVRVIEEKDGFLRVTAPGGLDGWVKPEAIISHDPWSYAP